MDAAIPTLQQIESLARAAESLSFEQRTALNQDGDAPNGKYYRRYNRADVCEELGGMNPRTVNKRVAELGIDPKEGGYQWSITLPQLQQLRQHVFGEKAVLTTKAKPLVLAIANLKGGAGKTMTCVTSAVGLGTQMKRQYRVGIIDLDPQGTATMYTAPLFDSETMLTAGDLMTEGYELEEGQSFADMCKAAFLPTNIPNLRVLPVSVNDNYTELWMQDKSRELGQEFNPYDRLQQVIDAVQDEFDIILIDTSPSLDYKVMNGLYAANGLIIPVQAHQNDQDATGKYLRSMTRIYDRLLEAGHPGYGFIKLLISRLDRRSQSEVQIAQMYRQKFGRFMMNAEFANSEAVKNCSIQMSTIYEYSAHEYHKDKKSLRAAQADFHRILTEIELMLLSHRGELDASTHDTTGL